MKLSITQIFLQLSIQFLKMLKSKGSKAGIG